jgi:hypothetical protein
LVGKSQDFSIFFFQNEDVEMEEMDVDMRAELVPSSFSTERLALVEDIDKVTFDVLLLWFKIHPGFSA